jgi:hypothetical protein
VLAVRFADWRGDDLLEDALRGDLAARGVLGKDDHAVLGLEDDAAADRRVGDLEPAAHRLTDLGNDAIDANGLADMRRRRRQQRRDRHGAGQGHTVAVGLALLGAYGGQCHEAETERQGQRPGGVAQGHARRISRAAGPDRVAAEDNPAVAVGRATLFARRRR